MIEEKRQTNKNADYYKVVGGYFGVAKVKNKWIYFKNMCYINTAGLIRWQGPPTEAMNRAMKTQRPTDAREIWPDRIKTFCA